VRSLSDADSSRGGRRTSSHRQEIRATSWRDLSKWCAERTRVDPRAADLLHMPVVDLRRTTRIPNTRSRARRDRPEIHGHAIRFDDEGSRSLWRSAVRDGACPLVRATHIRSASCCARVGYPVGDRSSYRAIGGVETLVVARGRGGRTQEASEPAETESFPTMRRSSSRLTHPHQAKRTGSDVHIEPSQDVVRVGSY